MIIVASTTAKSPKKITKPLLYVSAAIFTTLLVTPVIVAVSQNSNPTGTYLNPLPENEVAEVPTTTPTQTPQELILTAQAYLEKAITISQQQSQTESDKHRIVEFLNEGLEYANLAVSTSPNSPESYLVRARILASSASIRTDATTLAQKDLETAQLLSGGQSVSLPTEVNLINYTPTEQASLANNLIIAAPEEANTSSTSAETSSNINKKTAVIRSGKTSTTIKNSAITENSYIYLIPTTPTHTPFVQTKTVGQATIAILSPAQADFDFEYWIVNP